MGIGLSEKAMLVRLTVSKWTASKFDKPATEAVAVQYGTDEKAGRYSKKLVDENALKEIAKAASDARKYHYANTLPWNDDNYRLLPSESYMDYSSQMRQFKSDFESAAIKFASNFNAHISDAQAKLNGMFSIDDYPPSNEIINFFKMDVCVVPIPEATDFRVSLQEDEINNIRKEMEMRSLEAQQIAMSTLWTRLYDAVAAMSERLSDKNNIFRDSLVGNLVDLCSILPKLNITDDPKLEELRTEIESKLCAYSPNDLRTDMSQRKQAATDAADILSAMSGYIGGQ